jgi:neutral ceramidase
MRAALAVLLFASPASAADPRAGAAIVDVTPPDGYRVAGNYQEKLAPGALDPICAKALYFEQGDAKFVLIVCDVCGMELQQANAIRAQVAKATGVPASAVSVSATHTHGGPMHYDPVFVPLFAEKAKADGKKDVHTLGDYPTKFIAGCVKAATDAQKGARAAKLEGGTGAVPGLAFNRRFHMKDGTVRMNPGKLNADIVKPAGPVDEALPLLFVLDAKSGKPFASLCAFAMHTTTYGGAKFSADHPGHLQAELRKAFGPDFVSVYAEGCAGDSNQVNVKTKDRDPTPEQVAQKLAAAVRDTKRAALEPSLRAATGTAKCELRPDRADEVPWAKSVLIGDRSKAAGFLEQVEAYQVLLTHHMKAETGDPRPLEVQAFRLSADFAIVTLPHEVFAEIGLDIKARSPFKHTLVISIANEVDCYVPTKAAFAQKGSYEVTNSPYKPGVGEKLADEAVRLLKGVAK